MSDLSSKKVAELRALALEMGLETGGTKAQLIARISGDDAPAPEKTKKAAAAAPKKKTAAKKKKDEDEEDKEADEEDKETSAKAAKAPKSSKTAHETRRIAVDRGVTLANATVYPGHGVMLNQTNIGNNNNKFYVIQLLESNGKYAVWTRWGRVGENGQNALKQGMSLEAAKSEFAKKFKEKTKNVWSDTVRDNFKPQNGKYTLLDMREDDEDEIVKVAVKTVNKESKLDPAVQAFVRSIYNAATGNLKKNIDCEFTSKGIKTPLGVLSLAQVEKGDAVLDQISALLDGTGEGNFTQLTSQYYTLIPHAHGRQKPPLVNNKHILKEKQELSQLMKDMLQISSSGHESVLIEDDVDAKYDALGTSIASIPKKSATWNAIMHHISLHRRPEDYKNMTPNGCNFDKNKDPGPAPASVSDLEKKIVNIFALERAEEVKRFNHKIGNEHLLFHASRFENWVGILSRGLLQPDAVTKLGVRRTDFGWLGSGVYFGSEWSTSENYCQTGPTGTGCMLIQRVALGKVQEQAEIDGTIRGPKKGFDSIHGNPTLPGSGFQDHELCVYSDTQSRMEFLIEFKR